MLLRNSISSTKRFFQKTLRSLKGFISGENYQKLPKTPVSPHLPNSCYNGNVSQLYPPNYKELDNFYAEFSSRWDSDKLNEKIKGSKKKETVSTEIRQGNDVSAEFPRKSAKVGSQEDDRSHREIRREEVEYGKMNRINAGKIREDKYSRGVREERSCLVAQKLKELEKMDMSNMDHVLDIQEFLHYYSLLTCPAYLDIIDRFFMEMYAEFRGITGMVSVQGNTLFIGSASSSIAIF